MLQHYINPDSFHISRSKSQTVYHLGFEIEDENEIGEVNGGRYPERNQLHLFKSAGFEKSYYVVFWELCKECSDIFSLSCFLSLLPQPVVIITSLDLFLSFIAVETIWVHFPWNWTKLKGKQYLCDELQDIWGQVQGGGEQKICLLFSHCYRISHIKV